MSNPSGSEAGDVAAAIRAALARAADGMIRGDLASVEKLFAPDAIYVQPGGFVSGRDAIVRMYVQRFSGVKILSMEFIQHSVRVDGDVAEEIGTNRVTLRNKPGSDPITVRGRYLSVWRRQPSGEWMIAADAPMSDPV